MPFLSTGIHSIPENKCLKHEYLPNFIILCFHNILGTILNDSNVSGILFWYFLLKDIGVSFFLLINSAKTQENTKL